MDAKVNVGAVVNDTWSTEEAERKKEIKDTKRFAETTSDYIKGLLNALTSANGTTLCDRAVADAASIEANWKKRLIGMINKGLCALKDANTSLVNCQATAADTPAVAQALVTKGVKVK